MLIAFLFLYFLAIHLLHLCLHIGVEGVCSFLYVRETLTTHFYELCCFGDDFSMLINLIQMDMELNPDCQWHAQKTFCQITEFML